MRRVACSRLIFMPTSFRYFLRSSRRFFIGLICLFIGVGLLGMLPLSQLLHEWVLRSRNFGWNVIWINYSFMGDAFFAVGWCIYLFHFKQQTRLAGLTLISFCFTMLCLQFIHWLLHPSDGFSLQSESTQYLQADYYFGANTPEIAAWLPSHHMAVFLSWITVYACFNRLRQWQYGIVLAIALMGYSRFYLYPNQDFGGLLLGSVIGLLVGAAVVFTGHYRLHPAGSWKMSKKLSLPPARLEPESGFWHPAG